MFSQESKKEQNTKHNNLLSFKTQFTIFSLALLVFLFLVISPNTINAADNNQDEPSVKLSLTPSSIKMIAGQKAKVKINIERINYDDPVEIQTGEMPDGFEVHFEENPVEGDTATAWIYSPVNAIGCDNTIEFSSEPEATPEPKAKLILMVNCGIEWVKQFGSANEDVYYPGENDRSTGLTTDLSGNIYFVGNTKGQISGGVNPNMGGYDFWLTKYDKNGNRWWIQQFGSSLDDQVADVKVRENGDIFLAGHTYGDYETGRPYSLPVSWIGKRSPTGFEWFSSRYWFGKNGTFIDLRGNWVIHYYNSQWIAGFPPPANLNVAIDYYRFDGTRSQTNSGGKCGIIHPTENTTFNQIDIKIKDGKIGIVGDFLMPSGRRVEYIHNCSRGWRSYGVEGPQDRTATRLAMDSSNNLYVSGFEEGKAWIAKYDPTLLRLWHKYIENNEEVRINAIELNKDGDIIIAGRTNGVLGSRNGGSNDAWVARHNSLDGKQLWIEQFPVDGDDSIESIAFDNSNGIYLAGSTTRWDGNGFGSSDALLLKYNDPVANYAFMPEITGFFPHPAMPGQTIEIKGKNFTNVTAVHFNGEPARVYSFTPTSITVQVPLNVREGKVTVTTDCMTIVSPYDFRIGSPQ